MNMKVRHKDDNGDTCGNFLPKIHFDDETKIPKEYKNRIVHGNNAILNSIRLVREVFHYHKFAHILCNIFPK